MGLGEVVLLVGAGFLAGGVNSIAGGGSLISFPALIAVGFPQVTANVTNQVAVLPGYLGGSWAYRRELGGQGPRTIALGLTSIAGALVGSIVLVVSPPSAFEAVAPFLVLFSCALLAAQPAISRRLDRARAGPRAESRSLWLQGLVFLGAAYGGYFGAGLGIMLLAVLALGLDDGVQRLNALKGLLSLLIGAVSVAFFAVFSTVAWLPAAVMAVTSLAGGQVGVTVARRLSGAVLRAVIVAFGVAVGLWLLLEG